MMKKNDDATIATQVRTALRVLKTLWKTAEDHGLILELEYNDPPLHDCSPRDIKSLRIWRETDV